MWITFHANKFKCRQSRASMAIAQRREGPKLTSIWPTLHMLFPLFLKTISSLSKNLVYEQPTRFSERRKGNSTCLLLFNKIAWESKLPSSLTFYRSECNHISHTASKIPEECTRIKSGILILKIKGRMDMKISANGFCHRLYLILLFSVKILGLEYWLLDSVVSDPEPKSRILWEHNTIDPGVS